MSKLRMREIEEAEEVSAQLGHKPNGQIPSSAGGRPEGGDAAVSRATGISRQDIQRTRKHIAVAEEHPAFQDRIWKRSQVLAASEALQSIPRRERVAAVEMVSESGIPPDTATVTRQ
jgi:hypothetical protein